MKRSKKGIAILLCGTFLLTCVSPVCVSAADENASPKEENVYVTLATDGSVESIYVVNGFSGGEITDYGEYESVKILNTTDPISQDGDTITITSSSDNVYYQGDLCATEIPWDISIRYFLDGTEYLADEIAGKSGELQIRFEVTENASCAGNFYDDYALQVSFVLDTETCGSITAPDATIANVGSDKQLTYIILPGTGIDTTISADVTDFEMDAVSISGIRMNFSIEIDDEELMSQITELIEAIEKIDEGTEALTDGADELQDGAEELSDGADALDDGANALESGAGELVSGGESVSTGAQVLSSGATSLDSGIQSLNDGIAEIQAGLDALNGESNTLTDGSAQMKAALEQLQTALNSVSSSAEELQALVDASSAMQQAINDISEGAANLESSVSYEAYKTVMLQNGLDVDSLLSGNADAVTEINTVLAFVEQYESELMSIGISADTISQYISLENQIIALLEGNTAAIEGMETYLDSVGEGASNLAAGAQSLKESYAQFDTAVNDLADTLTSLLYEMVQLKDAVNTLVEEYPQLDDGLNAYTEGVAQVAAGYSQISSGASKLASGSSDLAAGSGSLYSGTLELLNGIVELYDATGSLTDGTGELNDGVAELLDGIAELEEGAEELNDGTGELQEETAGMDSELQEKIDEILESISGGDGEVVSFVSDKNTNVTSVQFAMQTKSIEVEEPEAVEDREEELTFWQKLLKLFGL